MKIIIALLLSLIPAHVSAQVVFTTHRSVPQKIGHFFARHELATAIIVTGLSFAAESAAAVHCHQTDPECYYTPNITGIHYSTGKIVGYNAIAAGGVSALEIGVWHWGRHYIDHDTGQHLVWFVVAPVVVGETAQTFQHLNSADTHNDTFDPDKWTELKLK